MKQMMRMLLNQRLMRILNLKRMSEKIFIVLKVAYF
jgi:hypothetical protein